MCIFDGKQHFVGPNFFGIWSDDAGLVHPPQRIAAAANSGSHVPGTEWAVMHCVKGGMARAENV